MSISRHSACISQCSDQALLLGSGRCLKSIYLQRRKETVHEHWVVSCLGSQTTSAVRLVWDSAQQSVGHQLPAHFPVWCHWGRAGPGERLALQAEDVPGLQVAPSKGTYSKLWLDQPKAYRSTQVLCCRRQL